MLPDPIIKLGKIEIYMYGVMIAVGILAAFTVLFLYGKKLRVSEKFLDFVFYNGIFAIVLGFGSAALFQATYEYIENPEGGFHLGQGITFIGGLIGGVAAFLLVYFILRKRLAGRLIEVLSIAPCCITIAHALGRVGCFFAGCCYGRETTCALGVKFPHLSTTVHPTQLYEAAFLFVLFGIMSFLVLKFAFRHNMSVYLVAYGIFRFLIEFVRNDDRGQLVAGISPSQFWSIGMVIIGIVLFFALEKIYKKNAPEINSESQAEANES